MQYFIYKAEDDLAIHDEPSKTQTSNPHLNQVPD